MIAGADLSMWRLLADNLSVRGDKIALVDRDRRATYAEVAAESGRIADWLSSRGIAPGDRVIVQLPKSIDEVVAMFGAWKVGAVPVNVNMRWTASQLAYVAQDSRASAIICRSASLAELAKAEAFAQNPAVLAHGKAPAAMGEADRWIDLPGDTGCDAVAIDPTALAMIIYTSGSTGHPKGVMLSHRNIRIGAISVAEYLKLSEDDRLLSVLPYSFDAGLNQLTTMMLMGGTTIHQPLTMPAEIIRMAEAESVTGIAGVPPLWNQIVRLLQDTPTALPQLRRITNTGGKIPPNILDVLPDVFPGADIYLMYGLTEAFRSTYLQPERFAAKKGSIGQAIPNARVFAIRHGVGIAGPGEQGELVHAGPLVSMGYWEKPDLTQAKIRPCAELAHLIGDEPVVWSGDLVRVDEDGDLWFVSRMDEMIKTLGFRLSPTEVEDHLAASGLVGDVVAYGVEDDELGQAVHVVMTLLPNAELDQVSAYCIKNMAHYMRPRRFSVWPEIMPRTASGKLDRPLVIASTKNVADKPLDQAHSNIRQAEVTLA